MNFDSLWHLLDNSVPPEVTHYQMGHHPGAGWWLKTVVPTNIHSPIYQAWYTIQNKHPRLVHMEHVAYDWHQKLITHTHSIWLNHKIDITVTQIGEEFEYQMGDYDQSFNVWGQQLLKELEQQQSPEFDQDDWHKLCDVAQLMQSWTTDRQARKNRRSFTIVKPEKNTSAPHNRSKLDPN